MKYTIHNYRHAEEIIKDPKFATAFAEIDDAVTNMPLFRYAGKSKNPALDIVQRVCNTYFDRALAVDRGWTYHPRATGIVSSGLTADFQKTFGTPPAQLRIQAEVQFGNMSRWYSDIFKFQAAYGQSLIEFGLSIVPMLSMATRIDSNIVNFERVVRELPSATLSITLPILVLGLEPDSATQDYDLRTCAFPSYSDINASGSDDNRFRIVHGYLSGFPASAIGPSSATGPKP